MTTCKFCGKEIQDPSGWCECGMRNENVPDVAQQIICENCLSIIPKDSENCPGCGMPIQSHGKEKTGVGEEGAVVETGEGEEGAVVETGEGEKGAVVETGEGEEPGIIEEEIELPDLSVESSEVAIESSEVPEKEETGELILSDGSKLQIDETGRIFGRSDFIRILEQDQAAYISRKHFSIIKDTEGFRIEDVGSANGTKLNDYEIPKMQRQKLNDGDVISIVDAIKMTFKIQNNIIQ